MPGGTLGLELYVFPPDLAYVDKAQTWKALQVFGNDISIGGGQFDVANLAVNDVIQWNGSFWVNVPASSIGGVTSVSNSDGTLTVSPTTGAVVASLALNHANSWTALQTFSAGDFAFGGYGHDIITAGAKGDLWYYSGTNIVNLGIGSPGYVLTVSSGLPAWAAATSLGLVNSVSNSDGTLTISPTTGSVVASLALGHANTWTATQTFQNIAVSADATYAIGTATNRFTNIASNLFSVYHASGDANPTAQLGDGSLKFGAGGASALNYQLYLQRADALTLQEVSSTANMQFEVMPKSTGRASTLTLWGSDFSADQANFQYARISTDGSNVDFNSQASGSLSALPMRFLMAGSVQFLLPAAGGFTFNTGTINLNAATTMAAQANTSASLKVTDGSQPYFIIDTRTGVSAVQVFTFSVGENPTIASASTTQFFASLWGNYTITLTGTTTVNNLHGTEIWLGSTLITDSSAVTVTAASTLYIDNAPRVGGSVTITNPYALYVNSGASYFGGAVQIGGSSTNNQIWTASQGAASTALYIGNAQIATLNVSTWTLGQALTIATPANTSGSLAISDGTINYFYIDTRTTTSGVNAILINPTGPTLASASGLLYSVMNVSPRTLTITGTTTVANIQGQCLNVSNGVITDSSAVTVTTASTFYVAGAPIATGSVTITNGYALYIASGACYFGGFTDVTTALLVGGNASSAAGISGLMISGASSANAIWVSSQGAASSTMYIGNASINVTASSIRFKEGVRPLSLSALDVIDKLQVREFDYREGPWRDRGRWVGLIAEEVAEIPELRYAVTPDTVEYHHLVALIVRAVQELRLKVA